MNRAMIPFLWMAVSFAACAKADSSGDGKASASAGASAAAGASTAATTSAPASLDAVLDAWKQAGLTVSSFDAADADKLGGTSCKAGQINGVDATLCAFASAAAAKAAEPKGLETVGDTTGASIAHGAVLLVIADRRKADPEGRTINQVTQLFVGKK